MVPRPPSVSVLVVCWNSAAYLPRCLDALAAQTYRDFEVIIVDNGSTDGAAADLVQRYPGLAIQTRRLESNQGFASANNVGARLASGAWLALLNPDAFPQPAWLAQLVAAAAAHPRAFFASRQIQANSPALLDGEGDQYYISGLALRRNYGSSVYPAHGDQQVFSACAAAAMYPRQDFLEAGGFDEDYFAYLEDVDLGFRLRLRGLDCIFVPAAVVHHVGSGSTGAGSDFAVYHGHRNLVWTYVKDMPDPWIWLLLPLHLGLNVFSVLYFIFLGRGAPIVRAKVDALRGLRSALRKRRAVQAQPRVLAAQILGQMDRNPFGPFADRIMRHRPRRS